MTVWRCLALCGLLATALAAATGWHQWRGPDRDGIARERGLLRQWPEGGPPLVWKASGLGEGYSSFAVSEGRIFTQGQHGAQQYVMAFDEATGKKLWEKPNGEPYQDRRGSGPRGTPTVDGEQLYALAANGNLLALRTSDGEKLWEVNLLEKYSARNIRWGLSESPLVDGDKLIVTPGGSGAAVVALDKRDGREVWRSQSDEAGYSSPVAAVAGGLRQYVVLTGEAGIGLRADNGELLWRYTQVSNSTANIATPIVRDNLVFLSTDYGTGCALLRLNRSNGGVAAEEVYFHRDMRNHYSSSVLIGDYLYGYSSRILTCMRLETGEVAWQDRAVGKGQVIAAEGLLYLLSEDGVVGLAEASPEGYREISRFEIGRGDYPTWTLPVIANGKLLLRDQDTLYCYDIKAR